MKLFLPATYFLFCLITALTCQAHQGVIKGNVFDSLSMEKIPGAVVCIRELNQSIGTDPFGNFSFSAIPPGNYHLQISTIGYRTKTKVIEVNEAGSTIVSFDLTRSSINLSEIVVTQNDDAASNSGSLGKIDLALRPFRSSQDLLKIIPGLFTAQHAGGGKAEQIFLRGFDIDHGTDIRLSVDGLPVNMVSHAHGQGYADLHFVTPEIVERVDFNKGPYYAQQGDFSTAGFADFKTRNSVDNSSLKMEAGQFETYRTIGMFDLTGSKMKAQNQSAYLSADYLFTNGYFESPQNFNRINLFGKFHGAIDENRILSLSLSTFSSRWEASGQIPQRAVNSGLISEFGAIDNKEGGNTSRSNINMILTSLTDNGGIFKNQLYFINYNFELFSNFTFFLEDSVHGDQIKQKESRNIYGYNSSYSQFSRLFGKRVRNEIGFQMRYDDINDIELSHTAQRKYIIDRRALGQINQVNASGYLDHSIYLTDKLMLNAGIRFDQFLFSYVDDLDSLYENKSEAKSIFSPKLNLYYNFTKDFQLYLKSGTGFHSNDTRVVVSDKSKTTLPRGLGMDLGFQFKPLPRLLTNACIWLLDLEQEFVYVGDAAVVELSGYTRRIGADLSVRYQLASWLFLDADVTYTKGRFVHNPEGGKLIPLAPVFTGVGGISTLFKNGFGTSLRCRYLGDRPANESNSVVAEGYFLMDAVINYKQNNYQVGFSVENVLNTQWKEAQFETESRLQNESEPVSEIHFTPGTPFFLKGMVTFFF